MFNILSHKTNTFCLPLLTFFWNHSFQKGIHSTKIQGSRWWIWLTLKKSLKRIRILWLESFIKGYVRGKFSGSLYAQEWRVWLVLHFCKPEECAISHLPQSHLLKCPSISKATRWFSQTLKNSFQLKSNITSLTTLNMKLILIMGSCILSLI